MECLRKLNYILKHKTEVSNEENKNFNSGGNHVLTDNDIEVHHFNYRIINIQSHNIRSESIFQSLSDVSYSDECQMKKAFQYA